MMLLRLLLAVNIVVVVALETNDQVSPTCSLSESELAQPDPALLLMTYDVGDGTKSIPVYVTPHVSTFYRTARDEGVGDDDDEARSNAIAPSSTKAQLVQPLHRGFAGKFINMSNRPVTLYWYVATEINT
jgi:hypothetical protein